MSNQSIGLRRDLILIILCLLILITPKASAQTSQWVDFVIPWDDALSGVATDVSKLNNKDLPRLIVKDGQFVEIDSGKRIRFWGTNLCFGSNFPNHADADAVAAHMAKYGINIVRLHHFDSEFAMHNGSSIWDRTQEKKVIDPDQLDRHQYLIAALAKHGIYVNLNLKVSKEINKIDGAALDAKDSARGFSTSYQKVIDRFDPFLIEHQKWFARKLLTTPNPYRDNRIAAKDPAVALVEINNENAAGGWPGEGPGANLYGLPEPYAKTIKTLWTQYLKAKYQTQDNLMAHWRTSTATPGDDLLADISNKWWPHAPTGAATITANTAPPSGTSIFHITKTSGVDWHAQASIASPQLVTGQTYTVSLTAHASSPRMFRITLNRNGPNYDNQGLAGSVELSTNPKRYHFSFQAGSAPSKALVMQLGVATGDITVSDVKLQSGIVGAEAFAMTQSIDQDVVDIPPSGSLPTVQRDWQLFAASVDTDFANQMRSFLRDELSVQAMITDTQMGWGGSSSLDRERNSDYTDVHAYWQHPTFGSSGWDSNNWTIKQKSMTLDAICKGKTDILGDLAGLRMAGKPYTVSEYDHPSPNFYQVEGYGIIASFASLQDWDGIFTFAYGPYGSNTITDHIQAFFDNAANPVKWAFTPSVAMIFRNQLIDPLSNVNTLNVPNDVHGQYWHAASPWDVAGGMPNAWGSRIQIATDSQEIKLTTSLASSSSRTSITDNLYHIHAPKACIVTGILGGKSITAGPIQLHLDTFEKNFAALTLVPLDDLPLAQSRHMLLTLAGQVQNQDMGWNEQQNSVGNRWGHGPVQIQRITGDLTCHKQLTIFPLAVTGTRQQASKRLTGNTLWYELLCHPQ